MNKFSFLIFIIVIVIFGGIIFATQGRIASKSDNKIPSLPPEANTFQPIKPVQNSQVLGAQQGQAHAQAQAQEQQQPPPQVGLPTFGVEEGLKASYSAVIKTSKGDIQVTLFGSDAPKTVKNFLQKAKSGFYKNLTFHRVEDWVVQGGDPKGDGTGGGLMLTEPNSKPFIPGSLGVARGGDPRVSNDSQFFITKSESSWLNQQYTNFGIVTDDNLDVVNKIQIGDKILGIEIDN